MTGFRISTRITGVCLYLFKNLVSKSEIMHVFVK